MKNDLFGGTEFKQDDGHLAVITKLSNALKKKGFIKRKLRTNVSHAVLERLSAKYGSDRVYATIDWYIDNLSNQYTRHIKSPHQLETKFSLLLRDISKQGKDPSKAVVPEILIHKIPLTIQAERISLELGKQLWGRHAPKPNLELEYIRLCLYEYHSYKKSIIRLNSKGFPHLKSSILFLQTKETHIPTFVKNWVGFIFSLSTVWKTAQERQRQLSINIPRPGMWRFDMQVESWLREFTSDKERWNKIQHLIRESN